MKIIPGVVVCALLVACDHGSAPNDASSNLPPDDSSSTLPPLPPPDGQGHPGPASGKSRVGTSYDVNISAVDGNNIAFTVHEPATLNGDEKYPLLLHGPGWPGPRASAFQRDFALPSGTPQVDTLTTKQYTDVGYGVISFDQRGFGQSGGTVTVLDPDRDGLNLVAILDWAESNLDWLQYRNNSLVLGAYGASYGGGYQLMLNNVDPRHRLKAIVPSIAHYDLNYSLGSGDVPKTGYGLGLIASGTVSSTLTALIAGGGGLDPSVLGTFVNGINNGRYSNDDHALLRYHSNAYFCDGISQEGKRPAVQPPKVDALILQGMYDVLFNFNEGLANYDCLRASGGDVRLITYTIGHVFPSGVGLLPKPSDNSMQPDAANLISNYYRCGPYVGDAITMHWFNAKLKQDPAAIAAVSAMPEVCINLGPTGEGVIVDSVPVGGANYSIPPTSVLELAPIPVTVPLFTASEPTVVAGIPTATLTLADPLSLPGLPNGLPLGLSSDDAIVFVSLAVARAGILPAALEIVGDQVRPVRGFGTQTLELNGIGIQLNAGDQLQLLVTGQSLPQYPLALARNPLLPIVTVSGSVQIPVLGNVTTLQ
ncbi:MAG: alpha/beta hydrolase family protein [Nevskiales bacterium]